MRTQNSNQDPREITNAPEGGYTVKHVQEMFDNLDLLITDDEARIKAAYKSKEKRWVRESDRAGLQGKIAKDKTDKYRIVKDYLPELLQIVQDAFQRDADTILLVGGVKPTEVPSEVVDNLHERAKKNYNIDDALAGKFVDRALEGIETEVKPLLVTDVQVIPAQGKITLRWKLPHRNCEKVIVKRGERSAKKRGHAAPQPVRVREIAQGPLEEVVDDDIEEGVEYVYEIYSLYRGEVSQTAVSRLGRTVPEVTDTSWQWTESAVELSWTNPRGTKQAMLFRREGARPKLKATAGSIVPSDQHTQLLGAVKASRTDAGGQADDTGAKAGHTYHYLVVVDLGGGVYSTGTELVCRIEKRPEAVAAVTAAFQDEHVLLSWQPVGAEAGDEYVIVRGHGTTPATKPSDGKMVAVVKGRQYVDESVGVGQACIYTVFTRRRKLESRTGTPSKPVLTLAEVADLQSLPGDGVVSLEWTPPANASKVVVRRSRAGYPKNHADSAATVRVVNNRRAEDSGLDNDRTYYYLVCCKYELTGGREVWSEGVRISETPRARPEPVSKFSAVRKAYHVVCSWTPVGTGKVVVIRTASEPGYRETGLLPAADLEKLVGVWLDPSEENQAIDKNPTPQEPYYSVFTVSGQEAAAGPVVKRYVLDDVLNLTWKARKNAVELQWDWPDNCQSVCIARRTDDWPEGFNDHKAVLERRSRAKYERDNNCFKDELKAGTGPYYYVVYAQPVGAPDGAFSPGTGDGCRLVIDKVPRIHSLNYKVCVVKKGLFRSGKRLQISWGADGYPSDYQGFAIVAKGAGVPREIEDGKRVFEWRPTEQEQKAGGEHEEEIDPPLEEAIGADKRFHCKLFHIAPDDGRLLRVTHPKVDVAHKLSGRGKAL